MHPTSPNIVLIGFMGSGKTTVSKLLGASLGRKVIDMDEEIARRAGFPSVAKIIDELGEPHFRELEASLAEELSKYAQVVISTGGGIITNPTNMESFRRTHSKVVFLECTFNRVQELLATQPELITQRPLFRDIEKASELFTLRQPIYRYWADHTISVDNLTPMQVCDRIVQYLDT